MRSTPSTLAAWALVFASGAASAAVVLYAEPFTLAKSIRVARVVIGIVGLQLQGAE